MLVGGCLLDGRSVMLKKSTSLGIPLLLATGCLAWADGNDIGIAIPTNNTTTPQLKRATPNTPVLAMPHAITSHQNLNQNLNQSAKFLIAPTKTPITSPSSLVHKQLALNAFFERPSSLSCQGKWHYPYAIDNSQTRHALADYGYYNAKDHAILSGDVTLTQDGRHIQANKLTVNPMTGQVSATDSRFGSRLDVPNPLMGVADHLSYNTKTGQVSAQNIAFASTQLSAHGYAQELSMPTNTSYLMSNAHFSTCPPDQLGWQINADSLRLDKDDTNNTATATAKNVILRIYDVPVFYLPYMSFGLNTQRKTGFLLPRLDLNSQDGLKLSTPYYINIAPNYDATLSPTFYRDRYPKLDAQFRYLTQFGQGTLSGAYLAKDARYHNKNRFHLFFDHTWQSTATNALKIDAQFRRVSDSRYLSDFDVSDEGHNFGSSPINLPQTVGMTYQTANVSARLKAQTFQKLPSTDRLGVPIADKDRPYSTLPKFEFSYQLPSNPWGLHVSWMNHWAYFKKSIKDGSEDEKSGFRAYNRLQMSRDFERPWGYFKPKVGLSYLYSAYDKDSLIGQNLSKKHGTYWASIPTLSVDTGLHLDKQGAPFGFGNGGYQVLSPRLKYVYSPYQDQSEIPNFETTLEAKSYDQLLADTWFVGYDRLSDLHAITPALSYRYIDQAGITRLDFNIADQIYLTAPKVSLGHRLTSGHSGLAWQATAYPKDNLWLQTSGVFDKTIKTLTGSLHYRPSTNALINAGVIARQHDIGQVPFFAYTASASLPLSPQWQLSASTQYDPHHRQFVDNTLGLSYQDCCVGLSIYGQEHKNTLNPNEHPHRAIMGQIHLQGLGRDNKLLNLLEQKIVGFGERLGQ